MFAMRTTRCCVDWLQSPVTKYFSHNPKKTKTNHDYKGWSLVTSLYSHDITLVLFWRIIKQIIRKIILSLETGASLGVAVSDSFGELFVLRFYGPVNPTGSCRARSVYLTTRLLGKLSPLSGKGENEEMRK